MTPHTLKFTPPPRTDGKPEVVIRVFRIPPERIAELALTIEAYEDIGTVRTLDRSRGIVELWMMADYEVFYTSLLDGLRRSFPLQELDRDFD